MKKIFLLLLITITSVLYSQENDSSFVQVPVVEHIDVFFTDTLFVDSFVFDTLSVDNYLTEYIYVADTTNLDTDTIHIDVIEYVELIVANTLWIEKVDYNTKYVDIIITDESVMRDTILEIEYQDIIVTYDNSGIEKLIIESIGDNKIYNLKGEIIRRPKGVYIENGKVKYKI